MNLVEMFGEFGVLNVWVVIFNGKLVVFELYLVYDQIVYLIRVDYDQVYKVLLLGLVLEYFVL